MLKLSGIFPSKWSQQPTPEQVETDVRDEWATFRALWSKQKLSRLEDKEWDEFKKAFSRLAGGVLQRADIIACTPAAVASESLKAKNFDDVLNDETSGTTALELLTAWRSVERLIMIGDDYQLALPVFTTSTENPFCRIMGHSPFVRFRDLHTSALLLNEQKRMPAGMIHLSNDIIYGRRLRDGKGTALTENPKTQDYKAYLNKMYPSVKAEPENLIYPIMLNIHGESAIEHKGTSIYNAYNVATTLDEIIKLLQSLPAFTSTNAAVATPYRAQLRKYRCVLIKANTRYPELSFLYMYIYIHIRMGTASYWQAKELGYTFVDLVRASNDAAELGFVKNSGLLNVLITCQTLGFFVVANERCVFTLAQQSERDNSIPKDEAETFAEEESAPKTEAAKAESKTPEDRKNATVIAIFDWMRQKSRVVNIAKEFLTEDYVDFPKPYVELEVFTWGGDAAGSGDKDDAGANVTPEDNVSTNAPPKDNKTSSANEVSSANATTSANEVSSADATTDKHATLPEVHYEHEPLHDKGGEDVITGGDEDDVAVDDEMPSAGGLDESDWAHGATTVESEGDW